MLSRGVRRLHFGRKPAKLSTAKPEVSTDLVQAAQQLRSRLNGPASSEPFTDRLSAVAAAIQASPSTPDSVFRLIARTLQAQPNYKGEMRAQNLQLLFRAVAKHASQLELATKLYADLYRHTKLSKEERLENGKAYYELLRNAGFTAESDKMVSALLKANSSAVTSEYVASLLSIVMSPVPATSPQTSTSVPRRDVHATSNSLLAIVSAVPGTPSLDVLMSCIRYLLDLKSVDGLEKLATYIYFENPHFQVPDEAAIVLLDAYLQIPMTKESGNVGNAGRKVLKVCLGRLSKDKTPLEVCELLLMCCVHFQEPVSCGQAAFTTITEQYNADVHYTKETWDVLAQWAVYSSNQPLQALQRQILDKMPAEFVDSMTLRSVLVAASDKAQCSEQQLSELVEYFRDELEIVLDAAIYEILIRRALTAVEVERARELFAQSNVDWNSDGNGHTGVLNELLVALCRTPSVPRQLVMDTYQRVRLFVPQLALEAQASLLEMFLQESAGGSATPAGIFLIEQFGERPDLPITEYRPVFDLLFTRILAATSESQAWDLFGILNCTIQLPYEAYYPLQRKLCDLGRPDAAHLLFRQLRSRSKRDGSRPPGNEMYLMLFAEYAKWQYEEGVHELETYFRLDLNNEMTTPMMNRMLAAYTALEDGHKVSHLWAEAVALPRGSIHGPNSETMCIMLQFFSTSLGLEAVDDLWVSMPTDFKIAPTKPALKQYVIANCYHGYYSRALEIVKLAPEQYGILPDTELLQSLYNWTMLPNRKQEVREYALEHFPKEWAELESTNGLANVLLPAEDELGRTDETSLRLAAIKQLEDAERAALVST